MKTATEKLTNLQLELVKLFRYDLKEKQLSEIRYLLANYFAEKATGEADKLWKEMGWTNKTMEKWSKEHHRTHYK